MDSNGSYLAGLGRTSIKSSNMKLEIEFRGTKPFNSTRTDMSVVKVACSEEPVFSMS